jgi:hypothetical protein
MVGDLFGERGCVGAVVEPDFFLDCDTGSVRSLTRTRLIVGPDERKNPTTML